MSKRYLSQLVCLLLVLPLAGLSQQVQIPVRCGHASDSPIPARPAPPRHTEAEAEQINQAGRDERSFLSIDEPLNFGIVRYRIAEYSDCTGTHGCYWSDLASQTTRAQVELKRLIATRKPGEKLAIVLDIDETSLSSYCEERREAFGYNQSAFEAWIVSPEASLPIPGTLELYNQALAAGVSVFFLTGRVHEQTEATARNLQAAGYKDWQGLILRDESERTMDTTKYKDSERKKIVAQGYRIILNMGDQWSDLNGEAKADISVKLPNPFYFLP